MVFNEKLIEGFDNIPKSVIEHLLFSIERDHRIDSVLTTKEEFLEDSDQVYWKDSILLDLQSLVVELESKGIIYKNLDPNKACRWSLAYPLFVDKPFIELSDEYIDSLRHYFYKSYCGHSRNVNRDIVRESLQLFLNDYPNTSLDILPKVFKHYVDTREDPMYVAKITKFINPYKEQVVDDLATTLEEYLKFDHEKYGGGKSESKFI